MRYQIPRQTKDLYKQNHFFKIENFYSESLIALLNSEIAKTIKNNPSKTNAYSPLPFFQHYNLWQKNREILKQISKINLVEMVSQLHLVDKIRLGFDLLFPQSLPFDSFPSYFFTDNRTKLSFSSLFKSISPILCLILVCLKKDSENSLSDSLIFSLHPGDIAIIHPEASFDLGKYDKTPVEYLIVGYTTQDAIYAASMEDSHPYVLKHMGYVFNEPLDDARHPIIWRSGEIK